MTGLALHVRAVLLHELRAVRAMLRFLGTTPIPDGPWSDSRAIAWIAKQSGTGFLELIDHTQKIVLLTPTRLERYGHWSRDQGITFSNLTWSVDEAFWRQPWRGRGWRGYDQLGQDGLPIEQGEDTLGCTIGSVGVAAQDLSVSLSGMDDRKV